MNEPKFKDFADTIQSVDDLPSDFSMVSEETRIMIVGIIKEGALRTNLNGDSCIDVVHEIEMVLELISKTVMNIEVDQEVFAALMNNLLAMKILTQTIRAFIRKENDI